MLMIGLCHFLHPRCFCLALYILEQQAYWGNLRVASYLLENEKCIIKHLPSLISGYVIAVRLGIANALENILSFSSI